MNGNCFTPVFFRIILGDQWNRGGYIEPDRKTKHKGKKEQQEEVMNERDQKGHQTKEN